MKVSKEFYCTQEKVSYKSGDEYKGDRKDIDHLLEKKKQKATPKKKIEEVVDKEVKAITKRLHKETPKAKK